MVPTKQQIDDSISEAWRFLLNSVKWDCEIQGGGMPLG